MTQYTSKPALAQVTARHPSSLRLEAVPDRAKLELHGFVLGAADMRFDGDEVV